MANVGSASSVLSPSQLRAEVEEESKEERNLANLWYDIEENENIGPNGPSSVEVQPDLSDSPRSISQSSHLEDFNESISPSNHQFAENDRAEDLDIMGIANTWYSLVYIIH